MSEEGNISLCIVCDVPIPKQQLKRCLCNFGGPIWCKYDVSSLERLTTGQLQTFAPPLPTTSLSIIKKVWEFIFFNSLSIEEMEELFTNNEELITQILTTKVEMDPSKRQTLFPIHFIIMRKNYNAFNFFKQKIPQLDLNLISHSFWHPPLITRMNLYTSFGSRTPLHFAIEIGDLQMIENFLLNGADPNIQATMHFSSDLNTSSLHLVVDDYFDTEKKVEMYSLLKKFGAIEIQDSRGSLPFDLIQSSSLISKLKSL